MKRDLELEATIVSKYAAIEPFLDERSRRLWAATESTAIGYGGDALVCAATGMSRQRIRDGRAELTKGEFQADRQRRPGGGRGCLEQSQPGLSQALETLIVPNTRGDPCSALKWTCKSRAGKSVLRA